MKKIIFCCIAICCIACTDTYNSDLYYNRSGKIVALNNKIGMDTITLPLKCPEVIIQDSVDTTLYVRISSHDDNFINKQWYIVHHIGDKVHFDYILKSRYFRIKK